MNKTTKQLNKDILNSLLNPKKLQYLFCDTNDGTKTIVSDGRYVVVVNRCDLFVRVEKHMQGLKQIIEIPHHTDITELIIDTTKKINKDDITKLHSAKFNVYIKSMYIDKFFGEYEKIIGTNERNLIYLVSKDNVVGAILPVVISENKF